MHVIPLSCSLGKCSSLRQNAAQQRSQVGFSCFVILTQSCLCSPRLEKVLENQRYSRTSLRTVITGIYAARWWIIAQVDSLDGAKMCMIYPCYSWDAQWTSVNWQIMQKHDRKNKTVVTLNCSNGQTIKRNYPKKKQRTKLQLYLNINNKHGMCRRMH